MMCSTGRTFALFPGIPVNPAFVTSDYRGYEVGIVVGSITESVQNDTRSFFCSAVSRRGTNFVVTVSFANLQLEFSGTYRMMF